MASSATIVHSMGLCCIFIITLNCGPAVAENNGNPQQGPTNKIIKIGVLLPFSGDYEWSVSKSAPAIQLATELVVRRNDLLRGYKFKISYGDTQCSGTHGPLSAIEMYAHKTAHVFLGPVCPYALAPVARYSPYWNIPVITSGGLVRAFDDKSEYKQLTRIGGSYEKLGEFVVKLLDKFDLVQPALVYEETRPSTETGRGDCYFTIEALYISLQRRRYTKQKHGDVWNKSFRENNHEKITSTLLEAANNSKVILLCGSPDSVREMMMKTSELGLDNGDYAFINIDLHGSESTPWIRNNDTSQRNALAKKAYENLKIVALRKPISLEYQQFSEQVKQRARLELRNTVYAQDEEVNNFVSSFHDAVFLYSLALNESLAAGYNITDGFQVTKRMCNRTFTGITGVVSIDTNGDRNVDYSVLGLNPRLGKFEVLANFYGNKQIIEEVEGKRIHFPGATDTPSDGFQDGSQEGFQKGFQEGYQEGYQEGFQEGIQASSSISA